PRHRTTCAQWRKRPGMYWTGAGARFTAPKASCRTRRSVSALRSERGKTRSVQDPPPEENDGPVQDPPPEENDGPVQDPPPEENDGPVQDPPPEENDERRHSLALLVLR